VNCLRGGLELLALVTHTDKATAIILLALATLVNSMLAIIVFIRDGYVLKDVEWLLSARRKLAGASEARLLRELQARPISRLLLEGPKPLAQNPTSPNADLDDHIEEP